MARRPQRRKKRVFVSFDYDNDRMLKHALVGQSRLSDSPFEISDHSLKETAPQLMWEVKARRAISRSEIVVVVLGRRTRFASGVLKEIRIARRLEKRVVQILPKGGRTTWRVPGAGRLYFWTWENLKKLLR